MGLFGRKKRITFAPNFKKSDYDNMMDFLCFGGTSEEWERLKRENKWSFIESDVEKYERYLKEVKPVADRYYNQLPKIQDGWSVLYNLGNYTGSLADKFEKACLSNIESYKKMAKIDKKHGQKTATNIPAFKRLAMLYEKQGRFVESVEVCRQAITYGMDERSRMARMIKKAGRKPTLEEQNLFEKE
jgi:hypothetical protein